MNELDSLLAQLLHGSEEQAEEAAASLPSQGTSALQALLRLSHSPEEETRWWATRALTGFETNPELVLCLANALQDPAPAVQQCAALALCSHPHPLALKPLQQALSSPQALTARLASQALISQGASATPALVETLQTGCPSAQREAARALAAIQDTQTIPALLHAMQTHSAQTQYWASQGLEKMGAGMVYLTPP